MPQDHTPIESTANIPPTTHVNAAPNFNVSIALDTNSDGSIKRTKNGQYRFSVAFNDAAGRPCAIVRGFRVAPPYMRLHAPISTWRDSVFTFIEIRRDLEDSILAAVKTKIQLLSSSEAPEPTFTKNPE